MKTSLQLALKASDPVAVAALRSALSAMDNAQAVHLVESPGPSEGAIEHSRLGVGVGDVPRRELSVQEAVGILRAEMMDRTSAADDYQLAGREEEASRLRAEAAVLKRYLDDPLDQPQPCR